VNEKGQWSFIFVVHTRVRERQTNKQTSFTKESADFLQRAY
jgi:hypothetical protein